MVLFCAAPWVAACGDSTIATDGGGLADIGTLDANFDAGEELDAGARDQGIDAPTLLDADDDGIPAAMDCDDTDAAVGATGSRTCASGCADGVELCADGIWAACDAPADCACPTAGATRTAACGNCGLESQRCSTGNLWESVSPCLGEGECAPAAFERDMSRCGDRARICDDACAWRPWTVTTPQGECEAPETRTPAGVTCGIAEVPASTCSAACTWVDGCRSTCERPPASSRTGAVPMCVPSGPFVLGSTEWGFGGTEASPVVMPTLSTFYIDRDMVTAGRYRACIAAGACTAPGPDESFDGLVAGAIALQLPYESAAAFCVWDGGLLPTEYQWEKAARGPAPDARLAPTAGFECGTKVFCDGRIVLASGSDESNPPAVELLISALPLAYSPWGVHQLGAQPEFTRTLFLSGYAGVALIDPGDRIGAGPNVTIRSTSGVYAFGAPDWRVVPSESTGARYVAVSRRGVTVSRGHNVGFRCVY